MCPWLQPIFLPNRGGKARRPFVTWKVLRHILNGFLVNQLAMASHVVLHYQSPSQWHWDGFTYRK